MDYAQLIRIATDAKNNSYSPYSKFRVGAAILTKSGRVYTGANVENASYGATICAERTAMLKAVFDGEREVKAVAIAGDCDDYIYPCGICRQFLAEFTDDDAEIICSKKSGDFKVYKFGELLPQAFRGSSL